jgi:pimeloyl-ACP methyl ester carboxylesterase
MTSSKTLKRLAVSAVVLVVLLVQPSHRVRGENVILKNGTVYRGQRTRDNTITWIDDGLKRIVLRDSKIEKTEADTTFGNWEVFRLVQPLLQHTGSMPKEAYDIEASPWNDRGRRTFSYKSARSDKTIRMQQAINELGPYMVKIRGVDGFWQDGRLSTNQVPREVVLGLLAKVDRKSQSERRRVASFLIQAEWYPEAKREINALIRDFPDEPGLRETMTSALASVAQLEAVALKAEIDTRRKAGQLHWVTEHLKSFPSEDVSAELLVAVREQLRGDEARDAADKDLADSLRTLANRLPSEARKAWKAPLVEVLKALAEAPDAVRDRFVAWQKAKEESKVDDASNFALAMSGYVAGSDAAVADLETASKYWEARNLLLEYLGGNPPTARSDTIEKIHSLALPDDPKPEDSVRKLELLTHLAQQMPPPLYDDKLAAEKPKVFRVQDDDNAVPTEYAVVLPPEYHPLRTYPAAVVLHGGKGPSSAIEWCQAEAARRGYILIAPEFLLPGQKEYTFSTSEHAAVELALRDARRRFAIDSDRVYLAGQLHGGNMAWDFGLAHPDLFAGVAIVSGLPMKYAFRYLPHTDKLPLYVALGDLAPAGSEIVFGRVRPLIAKGNDVIYSEHYHRGLEELPEEAPAVFDWMDRRKRDPYPKSFKAYTARECDARFYGVVVQGFVDGRATAPEAVEPLGQNLQPATIDMQSSTMSNLLRYETKGLRRIDVWVPPKLIDFNRRMEVRVNRKSFFKGVPKPSIDAFLEDLRLRGDRQQIYWMKVNVRLSDRTGDRQRPSTALVG